MKTYLNPDKELWVGLCERPKIDSMDVDTLVNNVFRAVEKRGDKALFQYALEFDKLEQNCLAYQIRSIDELNIDPDLAEAIQLAAGNIKRFHANQKLREDAIETVPGVTCWREQRPIQKVGLYIPGGTAPLFSSLLMLGIPALVAGCEEIIVCTPPDKEALLNPVTEYVCALLGIDAVYLTGGAQAIAALSLGTESIPKVDKIFGPGNQYVTRAKLKAIEYGVAIDMPAGPSEVLVISDATGNPEWIASDLLAQAEHGADSQVVFLTDSSVMISRVEKALKTQLTQLPRREYAAQSLKNSFAIVLESIESCIEFSNQYAPEHLILSMQLDRELLDSIQNAGSVFVGPYSCESAGDYLTGTNHTLPTNAYARMYSGVSLESFTKRISFQSVTREALEQIGPFIESMAEAEGLEAHRNAVRIRLSKS